MWVKRFHAHTVFSWVFKKWENLKKQNKLNNKYQKSMHDAACIFSVCAYIRFQIKFFLSYYFFMWNIQNIYQAAKHTKYKEKY